MIRDISPPIRPGIATWPGDTAFSQERHLDLDQGGSVNVSRINLSTHTGAHADAPLHFAADGKPIGALDLGPYIGPCRVIKTRPTGNLVWPGDVRAALSGAPPRILLRTYDQAPFDRWDPNFTAIARSTIDLLGVGGAILIGIDTPSIDPPTSKTLDAHHAAHRRGMAILEGLVLDQVPDGDYELVALPLRLAELDAAPVRAVLRELA